MNMYMYVCACVPHVSRCMPSYRWGTAGSCPLTPHKGSQLHICTYSSFKQINLCPHTPPIFSTAGLCPLTATQQKQQYSGALPPYCHTTATTVQRGPAPLLTQLSTMLHARPAASNKCHLPALKCLYLLMPLLLQPLQTT